MEEELVGRMQSQYINALARAQQDAFLLQAKLDIANEKIAQLESTKDEAPDTQE